MESKVMGRRSLDDALKLTGSFGRFHTALLILNIFFHLFVPWMSQVITFIGETPDHICKPNIGENQINYSLPVFGSTFPPELLTCERYVDPVWRNETEECLDGWWYDKETYGETIVTEFDLVCSRKGLSGFAQSSMMLGGAFGSVIAGFIADHVGRRPVIICTLAIYVASGCGLIFSPSFGVYIALFTIYGAAQPGFWSNCHILFMEYLVPSKRTIVSTFPPFFQSLGSVSLGVMAYFIRDWRYLQAVIITPFIFLLTVVWLVPESARWHISRGRLQKSETILKRIATINRRNSQGPFLHEVVLNDEILADPDNAIKLHNIEHTESTSWKRKENVNNYDVHNCHANPPLNGGFSIGEENEIPLRSHDNIEINISPKRIDDELPINESVNLKHKTGLITSDHSNKDDTNHFDEEKGKIHIISENVDNCYSDIVSDGGESKRSMSDVLKPPVLYITLSVCTIRTVYSMVYFGFLLNTGNLAGNLYLNFIIGGLIEIPGRMIPVLLIKRLGGRFIVFLFFLLSAITLVVIFILPEETSDGKNLGTVITVISLFGRFLVTVTNAPCLLLPMELFPTTVRTLGTGVAQFFGRFGGFIAPLMLYLDNIFDGFSLIVMAVGSLIASILAFLLPETLNEPQPETPEDLKKLIRKKRHFLPTTKINPTHQTK